MNKRIIEEAGNCMRLAYFRLRDPATPSQDSSAADELLAHYGRTVGERARQEFPGGILVQSETFVEALAETRRHLSAGTETLFEAAFSYRGVAMKADVLQRWRGSAFRLLEVKSGLEAADYLEDVAVQVWTLRGLGIEVHPFLMLIDRDATFESPSLFRQINCESNIADLLPAIEKRIGVIRDACKSDQWPAADYVRKCRDCAFLERCLPGLPANNPLTLYRGGAKVDRLLAMGVRSLERVPAEFKLSELQERQVHCVRSGRAWVSSDLQRRLAGVRYPLFFLDFEAMAHPLPQYPGQRPHHPTPFQWSCHIVSPGQTAEHAEYLCETPGDPRPEFAATLLQCVENSGSIVVYSGYEARIVKALADDLPEFTTPLLSLIPRMFDLHAVVRDNVYHPDFAGSFSIKAVLPALVPTVDYSRLEIQDGMAAVWAYCRMTSAALPEVERQRLAVELREYCALDTHAMFKIFERLLTMTKNRPSP